MRNTAEKIRLILVLAFIAGSIYAGVGVIHFAQAVQQHSTQLPAEFR